MARVQFHRLSFAIVDDNSHVRRLLRTVLYSFGAREIYEAEDGLLGLEAVDRHHPDILITDLVMPNYDGFELVRTIRNPRGCSHSTVPIIMLTGHAEKRHVLMARELGVSEFLCKPFSADSVYQRVRSIIERPRAFLNVEGYYGPELRAPTKAPEEQRTSPVVPASRPAREPAEHRSEVFNPEDNMMEIEI